MAAVGRAFAARTQTFGDTVHGGAAWPTRTEPGPNGRRYVNSFKSADLLSFADKRTLYAEKVRVFEAQGGRFDRDILVPQSVDELETGVRYDYCVLEDGTIRCSPRGPGLPDPGHSLLAEGGPEFADTRVVMAGELWVERTEAGEVAACVVACNSGHFKPYFEDVGRVFSVVQKLGVPEDRILGYGGPNNAASILPEIADRFGIGDVASQMPPSLAEARARLRARPDSGAFRPWQHR